MCRTAVLIVLVLAGGRVDATTWTKAEVTDPLTGAKVAAHKPMSFGGYIYRWESKYDLVFWPLTDENWICFNPQNGYAAFSDDFEKVTQAEKKKLTAWLAATYTPSKEAMSHIQKLTWMERVYRQRNMDDDFWCRYYRLMAYMHRENQEISLAYVRRAMRLLEAKMQRIPEEEDLLEVLFLLGEYNRRLGEPEKAQKYFDQVKKAKYKDEDGKERVGNPYYIGLVEDREKLLRSEKADASQRK